jgi:uncharacterized protein involved in exopolysaccharide biosynthesis
MTIRKHHEPVELRGDIEREIVEVLDAVAMHKGISRIELAESIAATPGNAISLDTLQRDYAAVRAQYDLAVQNKARAETGDLIEALSKGQRISIVEQAVAPREPARPNRVLIAAAGIIGGIAAGLGLIVLLEAVSLFPRLPKM